MRRFGSVSSLALLAATLPLPLALGPAVAARAAGGAEEAAGGAAEAPPTGVLAGEAPRGTEDLRTLEARVLEIVPRVIPAIVNLGGATGVVVSEDGYVLTAAHVGRRAGRRVVVRFSDGRSAEARTLGNDAGVDAGLVRIVEEGTWPFVEMGDSSALERGDWCLAIGYPFSFPQGMAPAVRLGRVSRTGRTAIVSSSTVMGGDSGGPLFGLDGKVIAITSRCDDAAERNVHVPVGAFRAVWEELARGEDLNSREPSAAFLGVRTDPEAGGAPRIREIVRDSAAAAAGLRAGDVLLTLDGKELGSYEDLLAVLRPRKPGEEVALEIDRDGERRTFKATLGRRQ
jgi:serine protease Do